MKPLFRNIFLLLLVVTAVKSSLASHLYGGQISYEHDTLGRYVVRLALVKECNGLPIRDTQTVRVSSAGLNINQIEVLPKTDSMILYSCSGLPCSSPGANGYQVIIYSDTISLTAQSNDWIISFRECCRPLLSNIVGSNSKHLFLETRMDNSVYVNNKSPIDYSYAWKYICVNNPVDIDLSLVEIDGDSVDYQLVAGLDSTLSPLAYNLPHTPSSPISNLTLSLNNQNGNLNVTPTVTGSYLVAYVVNEYRNNMLISSTYKDIIINVIGCTFIPPSTGVNILPDISGINGSLVDTISTCYDAGFNFSLNTADLDIGDSTKLKTIFKPTASNMTINSGQFQNGHFNWQTNISDTSLVPYLLFVQATDKSCGVRYKMFKLYVRPCSVLSNEDKIADYSLKLFPNPTTDITKLCFSLNKKLLVKVVLCDLAGRELGPTIFLKELKQGVHTIPIDLELISSGVYFLKIESKNGKKVIPIQKW